MFFLSVSPAKCFRAVGIKVNIGLCELAETLSTFASVLSCKMLQPSVIYKSGRVSEKVGGLINKWE